MRAVYKERLEALTDGARRFCDGALRLRPVCTGLHAVADLEETDDRRVHLEATARGVEVTPLSAFFLDPSRSQSGLLLGFGAVRPEALLDGMKRLGAAIEAAGRPSTVEHPKAARG
jgi:GntR family transcriptional regulator/MocR family aminotransferase